MRRKVWAGSLETDPSWDTHQQQCNLIPSMANVEPTNIGADCDTRVFATAATQAQVLWVFSSYAFKNASGS